MRIGMGRNKLLEFGGFQGLLFQKQVNWLNFAIIFRLIFSVDPNRQQSTKNLKRNKHLVQEGYLEWIREKAYGTGHFKEVIAARMILLRQGKIE